MRSQQESKYFACAEDDATFYDVYQLFQFYNQFFFQGQLERCTVRWTKKMTRCAGTCKYQGFGSSTISLSEPLLKFRNSNEVKETLLHEMIHAYLFKVHPAACQTEGGHGPAFVQKMEQINRVTGLRLSIYHSFHDEVDFYKKHVWRCNGLCRDSPPYYGYVKRSMNRAPQPADFWFAQHARECGGQFLKLSGPPEKDKGNQKIVNKKKKYKKISAQKDAGRWGYGKSIQDYLKQMSGEEGKKGQERQKKQGGEGQHDSSSPLMGERSLKESGGQSGRQVEVDPVPNQKSQLSYLIEKYNSYSI